MTERLVRNTRRRTHLVEQPSVITNPPMTLATTPANNKQTQTRNKPRAKNQTGRHLTASAKEFLETSVDFQAHNNKMSTTFLREVQDRQHHARAKLYKQRTPVKRMSSTTLIAADHCLRQPTLTLQALLSRRLASTKTILITTLSLIVIALAVAATSVSCQELSALETAQLGSSQPQELAGLIGNQQQSRHYEISIEPNKQAIIQCKLPQHVVAQSNRTMFWNFQRVSERKPELLCWGTTCVAAKRRGIELDFDETTGNYNLLIRNATYKDNDGTYYCEYYDTIGVVHSTEIQLTILIPPQPPSITPNSPSSPKEGQEYQLNCHSYGGNPEPNITWFKSDEAILPGAGVRLEQSRQNGTTTSTLTWIPTKEDHNATYRCSVSNRAMSTPQSYETTLQVEFAPRITVGPFNPLKVTQGDRATLSCQVEAHPPVKGIRWYRDGQQLISNHYNHTILEVKVSDSGVYSCQADNGIAPVVVLSNGGSSSPIIATTSGQANSASSSSLLAYFGFSNGASSSSSSSSSSGRFEHDAGSKTLVEARLLLEVQYAPRVQIRESRAQPLSENDHFVLNCSVDASPPAHEFVWTKQEDGQTVRRLSSSSNPTLEFHAISASDMGNYTCTAYNRLEPSGHHGQVYERSSSASIIVLVRHRPGFAEIFLGQNGETELGNQTQIQCRAKPPGYPEPKYSFWKWKTSSPSSPKEPISSAGPDYTIFSAQPKDEGRYGCMVSNEFGVSNEALGDLIVNEPPKISDTKTWRYQDTRRPGDTYYSLTVQATGKPEPKVAWFHRSPIDGRRVDLSSVEMQDKFRIETSSKVDVPVSKHQMVSANSASNAAHQRYIVVSTLTFKQPLEIDDRGLYSVEFSNGLSKYAEAFHQLHINHSPIPALKNRPVPRSSSDPSHPLDYHHHAPSSKIQPPESVTKTRAGFNVGEVVNLTCRVSAWPEPQFVWYNGATIVLDSNNNARLSRSRVNTVDDIWEDTLTFQLESSSEYGDYLCAAANADITADEEVRKVSDQIRIIISVGPKTIPEPPLQVEQVDATQESVTLQWLPGFDGGFPMNQFSVQYAPDDGAGLSLMRRYGPLVDQATGQSYIMDQSGSIGQALSDLQQSAQYPKLYDCGLMNPCTIGGLQPRQTYMMRVRARNDMGFSEFSDEIRVSTRANVSSIPLILDAHFDSSKNILHYRVEPNPEYMLNNLEMRVEVKSITANVPQSSSSSPGQNAVAYTTEQQQQQQQQQQQVVNSPSALNQEWRRHLTIPLRHERGEVLMHMLPEIETLKLTLCSRSNDTFCGQEFLVSTQSVSSSFLHDQHGLSMSLLVVVLFLLIVIIVTATTLHSRCLSRKAKKAAALERTDHTASNGHHRMHSNGFQTGNMSDNKQPGSLAGHINAGLSLANGSTKTGGANGSHGSTASTNSTSAGGGQTGQMQSLDSINQMSGQNLLNGGSSSDHSSDHSRQAKLDSMLPPNYSHYADRASLMIEQQQQQQQQQHQAYLQDKLTSPFGLPTNSLLGHNPGADPNGQLMSDYFGGYAQDGGVGATLNSLEHHQMLEATRPGGQHSMMMGSVLGFEPNDGQPMYSSHHQTLVDDYNNYNNVHMSPYTISHQDRMIESAYGTSSGVIDGGLQDHHQTNASSLMMAQTTQASFDNSANQTYLGYPNSASATYQDQQEQTTLQRHSDTASSQYQHDLAAAQQQMYGTLTRASSNNTGSNNNNNNSTSNNGTQQTNPPPSQSQGQQYVGASGLMPPPPLPPPPPPPQESDYGTTGGARNGGRLIREIIV